ncbi:hypothetical protein [Micromonospora sp. CB01531]|uniref:hypothetical protein n=1 Tax=Micromonospora sp. CB01531 TaxID=1718947 RepID=UPI000958E7BB|nr:hypothetical protein [Micromonospora sp. CB01531]OKI45096.1 hypothetical protein A6A27_11800 [Micromonospora sp. CB01531]
MRALCTYGQMTRAEYRAGAPKRPICTREATRYTTRPGTDYEGQYCDEHAVTGDGDPMGVVIDLRDRLRP